MRSAAKPIRGLRGARCIRCRVRMEACVCDVLPQLSTSAPVHVVAHENERRRSTSTGYLAARALVDGAYHCHTDELPSFEGALVLVAGAGRELNAADRGRPLVALDGSWRQARRMFRKMAALRSAHAVRLPAGVASRYVLRSETVRGGVSTLEAIAQALGVLEGAGHERVLRELLEVFVARQRKLRGF